MITTTRNLFKNGINQYKLFSSSSKSILYLNNQRSFCTDNNNKETNTTITDLNKDKIINNKNGEINFEILKYIPNSKYVTKEQMNKEKSTHLGLLGFYSKDTISLHNSYYIYEEIAKQTSDIEFYKQSNLPVNVRSWFALSVLHLWIVFVRLRKDVKLSKQLQIDLYDRFWEDLDKRIAIAGINKRFIPKYLKEFYSSYLGSLISYDESLFDDATLCNALWRNFYAMSDDVQPKQLLEMVKYIRVQLNHIDNLPNVIEKGELTFHSFKDVKNLK